MSLDRHFMGGDPKRLAAQVREVLLKHGLGRFHVDEIGGLVIEQYQHGGILSGTPPLEGTVELMYRSDGKSIRSNETVYDLSGGVVNEEKINGVDFTFRLINNLESNGRNFNCNTQESYHSLMRGLMEVAKRCRK